jgi:hypothetical protein
MAKDGRLRLTDTWPHGVHAIDLEPVWLAGEPAAGFEVAALQSAETLQNEAADEPFNATARERVNAIARRHKLPLPEYAFAGSGRKTPPDLKKFIGVWASVVGYNGGPVQSMLIVTDVNEATEADGYLIVGETTANSPAGARPARHTPFRGTIIDRKLSMAMPRSNVEAIMVADNSLKVKVVELSGRTVRIDLLPVWTLAAGLAAPNRAALSSQPTRGAPKRSAPPAPALGSLDDPDRGSRSMRRTTEHPGPGAIRSNPRFPACARAATQRGLVVIDASRRSFIRNCVYSG